MHNRTKIRKKIVSLLKNHTDAGDQVSGNRVSPLDDNSELPHISVTIKKENIEKFQEAPRALKRTIPVEIEIYVDGNTEEETSDRIDELCEQIENHLALYAINPAAPEWDDLELSDEVSIDIEPQGKQFFGSCTMTFNVKYVQDTIADNSLQVTDDFNKASMTLKPPQTLNTTENEELISSEFEIVS